MTRKVPVTTDLYGGLGLEDNDAEEDIGGAALGALEDVDDFESLRKKPYYFSVYHKVSSENFYHLTMQAVPLRLPF